MRETQRDRAGEINKYGGRKREKGEREREKGQRERERDRKASLAANQLLVTTR